MHPRKLQPESAWTAFLSRVYYHLYLWRRHHILGRPITVWAGVFSLLLGTWLLLRLPGAPFTLLLLLVAVLLAWSLGRVARRGGYARFHREDVPLPEGAPPTVGERIPVRVTGWLEVEGKGQWLVLAPGHVEFCRDGDWIVAARAEPSRYHVLGTLPEHQVGQWYCFLTPDHLHGREMGVLYVNARAYPSLAIPCPRKKGESTLYLSAPPEVLARLVKKEEPVRVPPGPGVGRSSAG